MIISTCGFGSSGSSAVSDYLRECEGICVMDALEFTLSASVDGLEDLSYHLMHKNPRQTSSIAAIQRFRKNMMRRTVGWKKRTGIAPERVMEITNTFLDRITQVSYVGFSPSMDKNQNSFIRKYVGNALIRRHIILPLERKGIIKENIDFYPLERVQMSIHPENFYEEARLFVRTLLTEMGVDFNRKVVLDQAFSGSDPSRAFPFYDEPYAVVVDRDPRDMYIFAKKVLLSKGRFMPSDTVENFIEYYRLLRLGVPEEETNPRILRVQFEDMVYNYEETTAKINRFLNVTNERPKSIFRPEMSAANTNLIRKFPEFAEDIKKIEEALPEYLFDFDKYPAMDNGGKMFYGKSPLNKMK